MLPLQIKVHCLSQQTSVGWMGAEWLKLNQWCIWPIFTGVYLTILSSVCLTDTLFCVSYWILSFYSLYDVLSESWPTLCVYNSTLHSSKSVVHNSDRVFDESQKSQINYTCSQILWVINKLISRNYLTLPRCPDGYCVTSAPVTCVTVSLDNRNCTTWILR